jgi:glucose/arabinose dehydrogenase
LVVTYRSSSVNGHRLVAFPVNEKGIPLGDPIELVNWSSPLGTPVDVKVGFDGALYITDNLAHQLLTFRPEP